MSAIHIQSCLSLNVEKLTPNQEMFTEIKTVVESWIENNLEKIKKTPNSVTLERLYAARCVNKAILKKCKQLEISDNDVHLLACYDINLKVKGIAFIDFIVLSLAGCNKKRKFLYLRYLSSDMENVLTKRESPLTNSQRPGLTLMQYLFEKCVKDDYAGIFVKPLKVARGFFERIGFVIIPNPTNGRDSMVWKVEQLN